MIKCTDCKQCNRKGKPSVMKLSAYCNSYRIDNKLRLPFFSILRDKILKAMYKDGIKQKIKGFR